MIVKIMEKLPADPFQLFSAWYAQAEAESGMQFFNSMSLATVSADGKPSVRIVLLKDFQNNKFTFYTNYESRKGNELKNPFAALCFYWDPLGKQVRIEGTVRKTSRAAAQEYFDTRPRDSRLGAWASQQSQTIPSRVYLETKFEEAAQKFPGEKIPVPDYWGGYELNPNRIEFMTVRPHRLHDRFLYTLDGNIWNITRLSP